MISVLALVFVVVMGRASLLESNLLVLEVVAYQSLIILGVLGLSINVSRLKRLSYEGHQVIVFISTTKNQRVEAAAAVLDPEASIVPAIMPMIQSIPAIVYLHISSHVKHRIKAR